MFADRRIANMGNLFHISWEMMVTNESPCRGMLQGLSKVWNGGLWHFHVKH